MNKGRKPTVPISLGVVLGGAVRRGRQTEDAPPGWAEVRGERTRSDVLV